MGEGGNVGPEGGDRPLHREPKCGLEMRHCLARASWLQSKQQSVQSYTFKRKDGIKEGHEMRSES